MKTKLQISVSTHGIFLECSQTHFFHIGHTLYGTMGCLIGCPRVLMPTLSRGEEEFLNLGMHD